jgi:hypothetical protein
MNELPEYHQPKDCCNSECRPSPSPLPAGERDRVGGDLEDEE